LLFADITFVVCDRYIHTLPVELNHILDAVCF